MTTHLSDNSLESSHLLEALTHGDQQLCCDEHRPSVDAMVTYLREHPHVEYLPSPFSEQFDSVMECLHCQLIVAATFRRADDDLVRIREATATLLANIKTCEELAASRVRAEVECDSHTLIVGQDLQSRLLERIGLSLVRLRDQRVTDMMGFSGLLDGFRAQRAQNDFSISLLRAEAGATYQGPLPLEEGGIILLGGEIECGIQGGTPITLTARRSLSLAWMTSDPCSDAGIPPVRIRATRGRSFGLFLSYAQPQLGMRQPHARERRHMRDWSPGDIEIYWRAIERRVSQMHDRQPFLANLLFETENAIDQLSRRDGIYEHDQARHERQFVDLALPRWNSGAEGEFHLSQRKRQSAHRIHPMFDFYVIDLPESSASIPDRDIEMTRHSGCYEVLIPLFGRVRYAVAASDPRDESRHRLCYFADNGRRRVVGELAAPDSFLEGSPDVLSLNSDEFHGFTAGGNQRASMLCIRCHSEHGTSTDRRLRASATWPAAQAHAERAKGAR
jgi:hypothetical protein